MVGVLQVGTVLKFKREEGSFDGQLLEKCDGASSSYELNSPPR